MDLIISYNQQSRFRIQQQQQKTLPLSFTFVLSFICRNLYAHHKHGGIIVLLLFTFCLFLGHFTEEVARLTKSIYKQLFFHVDHWQSSKQNYDENEVVLDAISRGWISRKVYSLHTPAMNICSNFSPNKYGHILLLSDDNCSEEWPPLFYLQHNDRTVWRYYRFSTYHGSNLDES